MTTSIPATTLEKFTTFGDLLRFLRRRAGITQTELSIAVGYSISQISRLEQNLRLPDIPTIEARFIAPLCLEDEPTALARLLELAAAVRREDAPASGLSPYKGLDYFDESDADMFVGREALTEKLLSRVHALASKSESIHGRFFAIVGASGSGKSSLVRAGLVPALRWDKRSTNWQILFITPTAHPLESLAAALIGENISLVAVAALMDDLSADPRTLGLYVNRELKKSSGSYFLLAIDQFEELFSLCRSEAERSAFINNLLTATSDEDGHAIVLITLRADFYTHCANYLPLREALAQHQEYIGAMSDEEMRRAIEEPARRGRWEFEPGLVDLILHDVGHEPGALPLLSHALLETWQRRQGRTMTLSGYTSAGGVRGAIAETAETIFTDQFTHQQQVIARRIFLRLTELGDETATGDTRRRATIQELISKPEEADATQAVLKSLADARLVTTSEDSVQVAHEALIREWPTLRSWLEDNREGLRLHRQLIDASQEWLAAQRESDMLFRGARLAQAREWAVMHAEDMNALEREFLEASITFSEQEAAEREAARQRELEAARKLAENERQRAEEGIKSSRRLKRRALMLGAAGALSVLLAVIAVFAWQQSISQAAVNLSLSLAGAAQRANQKGNGDLALRLAMEAAGLNQAPPEALRALREVALGTGTRAILKGHELSARAVDISPDGKTALSGSCARVNAQGACQAGELILWDLITMIEIRRWSAHHDWVNHVAYSTDGQYLISCAQDGSLILSNLSGEKIQELSYLPRKITALAAVPKINGVLLGFDDGSLDQWDVNTGDRQPLAPSSSPITALAIATQVPLAVTAHQDGTVSLWDLYTRQLIQSFPDQGYGIQAVAISSDNTRIFLTSTTPPNFFVRMIDAKDGRLLNEQLLACIPSDLALSPDGAYLLVGCMVDMLQIDIQNWRIQHRFGDFSDFVNAISIDRSGNLGITAIRDGSLRVWNLRNQEDYQTIDLNSNELTALAVSPDGKYVLLNNSARDENTQPALWDITQKKVVRTYALPISDIAPGAITISPDGRYAAAAGDLSGNPTVVLWDLESGKLHCPPFEGYTVGGRAVAFSPDGQSLLAGSQIVLGSIGELFLWDVLTCKLVRQFETTEDVSSIAFNSDGSRALTGAGFTGRVTLWDVSTGKVVERYSYIDRGPVLGVAFGPGERTILGSGMADLYLWDAGTKNIIRRYTGLTMYPYNMALSPNGKYVLSGTSNGEVLLWDFLTGEEVARINTNLSVWSVAFTPDSQTAFVGTGQGKLIEWHVAEQTVSELLSWIESNRYVRELTPEEKQQYHLSP